MDLTEVYAYVSDIERELDKDGGYTMQLFKGNDPLGAPMTGFTFEKRDFRASGGKKFYEIVAYDTDGMRAQHLAIADKVKVNNKTYKITDKDSPEGDTLEWFLELQPLGLAPL